MNIVCSGPGPHVPTDGVLGTSDVAIPGALCPPCRQKVLAVVLPPERAAQAQRASARSNLSDLLAQQSAFSTQLQADISTVTSTGWAALSAADQQAIMLRVLDGFGTVMTAIANHLTVTGIT